MKKRALVSGVFLLCVALACSAGAASFEFVMGAGSLESSDNHLGFYLEKNEDLHNSGFKLAENHSQKIFPGNIRPDNIRIDKDWAAFTGQEAVEANTGFPVPGHDQAMEGQSAGIWVWSWYGGLIPVPEHGLALAWNNPAENPAYVSFEGSVSSGSASAPLWTSITL